MQSDGSWRCVADGTPCSPLLPLIPTTGPNMTSSICIVANNVTQSLISVPLVLPWILAPTHALIDESSLVSIWTCDSSHLTGYHHGNTLPSVSNHKNQSFVDKAEDQPLTHKNTMAMLMGGEQYLEQPATHNSPVTVLVDGEECMLYRINGNCQREHYYDQQCDINNNGQSDALDQVYDNNGGYNSGVEQAVYHNNEEASIDNGDNGSGPSRDNGEDPTLHFFSCGRRKKQSNPRRSALWDDPYFRGVIVRMKTLFDGKHCRLDMSCEYRLGRKNTSRRLKRRVIRYQDNVSSTSSSPISSHVMSDSQSDSEFNYQEQDRHSHYVNVNNCCALSVTMVTDKECASCRVRKTPLWRDAEDGTPLCNACGIRYKKYRVRCGRCWNIPKKDTSSSKSSYHCSKCGNALRLVLGHRANKLW